MQLTLINRLKTCLEVLTTRSGHAHPSQEKQLSVFKRGYAAGFNDAKNIKHDHSCYCGTGNGQGVHETGSNGCKRFMTDPPDLTKATLFTYQQQRSYHQHPCGCWSRHPDSSNSIDA